MSTSKVWLTTINDVRPHPNADALNLATVHGWQVAVKKGQYVGGERIAYFEQGVTIGYDAAEKFGVINYLSEKTNIEGFKQLVVHRVKLRGEPSFGLVVPAPKELDSYELESDISFYYGATKFEPPVRVVVGNMLPDHPMFPAYTEIENLRSYPDIFREGEPVIATEKIHGTNARVGFVTEDGQMVKMAGSRRYRRDVPQDESKDAYWLGWSLDSVKSLMQVLFEDGAQQAVLYGEVYGKGVQQYQYNQNGVAFRAFDLMVNGQYYDNETFRDVMTAYGIPVVPVDYEGEFSIDAIKRVSESPSTIGNTQGREGVVIRPAKERNHPTVGRVVLKWVGDQYLFGKVAANDTTDA